MPKEKSIGAVVFRKRGKENLFLLLHYNAGHWGFPKGHVEKGETEQQTLLREVSEETGLTTIKIVSGFKQYTKYFFKRRGETVFKEVIFYLVKSSQNKVKISHEHQAFEWLPFGQAMQRLTFQNTKLVIAKAMDFLQNQE